MSNLIPFQFESYSLRVITGDNGEPLFVGKDLCEALGYKDTTNAMKQHCKGVAKHHPLQTAGGQQDIRVLTEPDMYRLIAGSQLPAAQRFEAWVFDEVLPSIRKTGSYTKIEPTAKPSLVQPAKEFRAMYGIARLIGFDKNVAAISANQAVAKLTGTNVLQLLGHTHLEAEKQEIYYTPTELGLMVGVSGMRFNTMLAETGLQEKSGGHWVPQGKDYCRVLDTGKRHGDGTMIQQIKWSQAVLKIIGIEPLEKAA
jgi:prophage antirepressor-like protein